MEELDRQIFLLVLDENFYGINTSYLGAEAGGLTVFGEAGVTEYGLRVRARMGWDSRSHGHKRGGDLGAPKPIRTALHPGPMLPS